MGKCRIQGQEFIDLTGVTKQGLPNSVFENGKVPAFARCVSLGAGFIFHDDSQAVGAASVAGQIFELGECGDWINGQAFRKARFTGTWEIVVYYARGGN